MTVSSWGNRRLKFSQETLRIDIYVRVTGWCCSRCNAYTLICITWLDNNSCVPIISLTQELNPSILCLVTRSHAKVTGYLGVKLPKFKIYNLLLKDDIATIFFFSFHYFCATKSRLMNLELNLWIIIFLFLTQGHTNLQLLWSQCQFSLRNLAVICSWHLILRNVQQLWQLWLVHSLIHLYPVTESDFFFKGSRN